MDKDKETGGQDELREIVATLQSVQKAQKRQRMELLIGLLAMFVLLVIWAQWPAFCLPAQWLSLWRPCW